MKDGDAKVKQRFLLMDTCKSLLNMSIMDSEDMFTRHSMPFSGIPDLLEKFLGILSAAFDIPQTRLLGSSPGGLNSTGDGDIRNYYDSIGAEQENKLSPHLDSIDEALIRSVYGLVPDGMSYKFKSLWQMNENEEADLKAKQAGTLQMLQAMGAPSSALLRDAIELGLIKNLTTDEIDAAELLNQADFGIGEDESEGAAEEGESVRNPSESIPSGSSTAYRESKISKTGKLYHLTKSGNRVYDTDPDWDESKHPRADDGKFGSGGGGGGAKKPEGKAQKQATENNQSARTKSPVGFKNHPENAAALYRDGKKWTDHDGNHITKEMSLNSSLPPPGWTDTWIDTTPGAKYAFGGIDSEGRLQYRRSTWYANQQANEKHERIDELRPLHDQLNAGLLEDAKSDNPKLSDSAQATYLISLLGLRPGSEKDTKAKKQAYGATTLLSDHIRIGDDGKMNLTFTGKDGVAIDLDIDNKAAYDMLSDKKKSTESGKRIFPNAKETWALKLVKKHTGNDEYKTKDLRTLKANDIAIEEIAKREKPKTLKEWKSFRNDIGDIVSKALGNTRTMALNEYINPKHFEAIKPKGE
jgi:DNA topoisomerase IB